MSGGGGGECFTCLSPGVRFYQVCSGTYSACGAGTGVPEKDKEEREREREVCVCQCCYVCGGVFIVVLVIAVFGMEKRYRQ